MTINKKIQIYIENKGFKFVELAKKLGISKQNLSRILNSDDLKVSQLLEISKALEVSPGYFLNAIEQADSEIVSKLKSEMEFVNKLYTTQLMFNKNEEKRWKLIVSYFAETIGFIIKNKAVFERKYTEGEIHDMLKALFENVMCRYDYALSHEKFMANIVLIFSNPELFPVEPESDLYKSMYKTSDLNSNN